MVENKVWTTAEGEQIPIKKMTTAHLLNSISYLEKLLRHHAVNVAKLAALNKEAKNRGLNLGYN